MEYQGTLLNDSVCLEKKGFSEGDYTSVNINALKNSCVNRNQILRFTRGVYLCVS